MTITLAQQLELEDVFGYRIGANGRIDAPCGCPACDVQVQQGHFACSSAPQAMLEAEERGQVVRAYDDGEWQWIVVEAR